MNLRGCLACFLAGSAGCAAIANLQSYSSGAGDAAGDDAASDGAASDGATNDGGAVSDGAANDGAATDASSSADAATDATTFDAAGEPVTASCKELLIAAPATAGHNGLYKIDPDGTGPNAPVTVFCEMSLDQGGWTLIGRSAGSAIPFGWSTDTGTPTDMSLPYSLNVARLGLAFSQLLVSGADGTSLDAAVRAYRVGVPVPFVVPYADAAVATSATATLFGDCNPPGGPMMLKSAGWTAQTDVFFLRDVKGIDQTKGLLATGFDLTYDDCPKGGMLNKAAGLLFVR